MPLTVGGGVRTIEDIRKLLHAGADKVSINTAAVHRRQFVAEGADKFGAQCIVVAIDAKQVSKPGEPPRWELFTHGGRNPTGLEAVAYAREVVGLGAGEILLTSMDRDGTKAGFDLELTRAIADAVSVPVIASGGVGTLDHLVEGVKRGPCQRRAGGLDLPLRDVHDRRGQAPHGRRGHSHPPRCFDLTSEAQFQYACLSSTSSMPGRRGRGPLFDGISSRMSSMGGTRKLQAAQNEWSRRFTLATMPATIAEAMATTPQMAMTLAMMLLDADRSAAHGSLEP